MQKYSESEQTKVPLYTEWGPREKNGLRQIQESYIPLYERTRHFRKYLPGVIPGFLQTPSYATSLLTCITEFRGIPDDVESAVEARMERSRLIQQGERSFEMVIEEATLRYCVGTSEIMAEQLKHMLTMMPLPHLSLGIIPSTAPRSIWPIEGFTIYDDSLVQVELLTAEITVQAPTEVATYTKAFGRLQKLAVYGPRARALITSAIEALD
ncbi:DUF5753 domain-containing protein [Nocardiopsis dassonvillei]|uniref:DUF5753 domain-containing protein n=1 Tax=Nocardiopsis dassonvillei TaxID=2014 RepID=UPI0020101D8C|nr:DUF5753 domain-containing protein [Nocardiopsis dassonvillei]MCK9869192.1 DUF5753 domain-containing protein [Nocardiopsis dassonvillei]